MALGRVEDSPIFEPDIDVVGPSEMPVRGVWEKTVLPSFPKWPLRFFMVEVQGPVF